MNKSKFLKKSLAAILSVLLVVAMIPLSAAAAVAEVTEISIGGVLATGSGGSWNIEIPAPEENVTQVRVVLGNHGGVVRHYNDSNSNDAQSTATNTWVFPMTASEIRSGTVKFDLFDSQGATDTEQNVTLSWKLVEGSNDTSVKSVINTKQYGDTTIDTSGSQIIYKIVLPYESSGPKDIVVTPSHTDAVVRTTTTGDGAASAPAHDNGDGSFTITTLPISSGKTTTRFDVVNGSTIQNYVVETINASAFATFSVAGERKAAKIDNEARKVTVYMPYGTQTNGSKKLNITPTFTKGYEEVSFTINGTAFESGKEIDANKYFNDMNGNYAAAPLPANTPIGVSDDEENADPTRYAGKFSAIPVTVKYSDKDTEIWTIEFQAPLADPQPTLKGLKVGNFVAEIDEANHTALLQLPSSLRVVNSNALMGLASKDATILIVDMDNIVEQTIDTDGVYEYLTCSHDDGTADESIDIKNRSSYWIRVKAAGNAKGDPNGADKAIQDYRLTIETVETTSVPVFTAMRLEDPNGTVYTGSITDTTVLFNLPFNVYDKTELDGWKLYYDVSSGAYVLPAHIKTSGFTIDDTDASDMNLFPTIFDGATKDGNTVSVYNELGRTDYKITIKQGVASTASTMTNFKVTSASSYEDMVDGENTFTAKVSGRDLTVEIPYSLWEDFQNPYIAADLPDGAKLFYVSKADAINPGNGNAPSYPNDYALADVEFGNGSTDYASNEQMHGLTILTEDGKTGSKTLPAVDDSAYGYDGEVKAGDGTIQKLDLILVSEKAGVNQDGTSAITWQTPVKNLTTGEYTSYTLTIKRAAPNNVAVLDSFSIYDAVTKTRVAATVDNSKNQITLTLPASFVNDGVAAGLPDGVKRELWYDYKTSHYENVIPMNSKTNMETGVHGIVIANDFDKLVLKDDGTVKDGTGTAVVKAVDNVTDHVGTLYVYDGDQSSNEVLNYVRVEAEAFQIDGQAGIAREYEVIVKYEEPRKQAVLNSVTINGQTARPDSNGKMTIILPMGTDVTGLRPTFDIPSYAFVSSGANYTSQPRNELLLNSGDLMNFTFARKIYVFCEDGSVKRDYTIEVKTQDAFSDVHESDWFYGSVMEAYGAGIIAGRGNGIFDPYGSVTRAEFATMIARVDGFDKNAEITNPFSDMQGYTGEVYNAVAYCADKGYISGYGDTTFKPGNVISRQEMAVILCRVLELDAENVTIATRFADDGKIASWAKNYVYACVNANMLYGEGGNTFNPLGSTNRAAAATVAVRVDHAK